MSVTEVTGGLFTSNAGLSEVKISCSVSDKQLHSS